MASIARLLVLSLLTPLLAQGSARGQTSGSPLPEGTHRDVVQRSCSACHSVQMFTGRRMSRQQWGSTVSNMIGRGAKISDDEFNQILDYLSATFPPGDGPVAGATPGRQARSAHRPSLIDQAGSNDKQMVDEDAAARGRTVYIAQCITCHGTRARGGSRGADLVRSVVVLHDRYGSTIGPYLANGHPAPKSVELTPEQIVDLSHFLHQQIGDTLRTGPYTNVLNILVGDAAAGKAYFEGPGGCSHCHSVTGDLAHIAGRYDALTLQQKVVFPQNRAITRQGSPSRQPALTVTVTPGDGQAVTGTPSNLDDFNVSLSDAAGRYYSFTRAPNLKVEKQNPYIGHEELLDRYTDKDIHDVVSYLETLQ